MPFDGKTYRPDAFSLDSLIAWLETKDPAEEYCWGDSGECLFGQWGKATAPYSESPYLDAVRGLHAALGTQALREPGKGLASRHPHTFGAALHRARAIIAEGRE